MSKAEILKELPALQPADRREIFDRLCDLQERDLLAGQPPTPEEKALLDRELEDYRKNPGAEAQWHTAITASKSILELEEDWDDQGSPRYAETTWQRAVDFLVRQADFARSTLGRELPVPKILPGPQTSIDLHWKLAGFELLVNIPSDAAQPTTFYGDDYRNSCIRGNLNPAEEIRGLVVWLLT